MIIKETGTFIKGLLLLITFFVVLIIMLFAEIFEGENSLRAADKLFNSIAKGSTNYIPGLVKKTAAYDGVAVELDAKLKNEAMVKDATTILTKAGAQVSPKDKDSVAVKADLGKLLGASLKDSEAMFNNNDKDLTTRYGIGGRETLFVWWNLFKEFDKSLKRQSKFKEAKFVEEVGKKGVEVGYNFFKIDPQTASSKAAVLTFSLVFYVVYTLWFGIAVLLLFEGFGLQMKKGAKKEV